MQLDTNITRKGKARQVKDGSSGQKIQASLYWIIAIDWTDRNKRLGRSCKDFNTTDTQAVPNTVQINIGLSPPRRVQFAQTAGTQGEEGFAHGIGLSSPLVGRPGSSGELEAHQSFRDSHSTTAVITTKWMPVMTSAFVYSNLRSKI